MPKAKLIFDLNEEASAFKRAVSADASYGALWDISQEIFRPARKHGYSDKDINDALEKNDAAELVALLEAKFYKILDNAGVSLEDYG